MITTLLRTMRLPFLILTPVCIFVAASLVIYEQVNLDFMVLFLALIAALFAHISANALNEYLDFTSGLDATTKRTAFSGGSGALIEAPNMKNWVLYIALLSLLVTLTIGLFFYYLRGPLIMIYGVLGIFLILAYTRWLNKSALACLIAPGLGFGTIMVSGSHFALSGTQTCGAFFAGLIMFFLTNNLLLLNQFPDIDADQKVGRNHLSIRYGVNTASKVYALFALLTALTLVVAIVSNSFPQITAIALLPLLACIFCYHGSKTHGSSLGDHPVYLGVNTIITLVVPLIIAVALLLT
ncbi:prenyltransferase [Thalassotalea litorea]|uniref:prenyltransferase n=1 Tax=Thalassotalea litorea TaxID=2020715 RepID=UPI0037362CA5